MTEQGIRVAMTWHIGRAASVKAPSRLPYALVKAQISLHIGARLLFKKGLRVVLAKLQTASAGGDRNRRNFPQSTRVSKCSIASTL